MNKPFAQSYKNQASEAVKRAAVEAGTRPADDVPDVEAPTETPSDLTLLADDVFTKSYADALEMQESLANEAANAEAQARKALADFRVTPTKDAALERMTADQIADNAQRAATEHAASIQALRTEHTRRSAIAELPVLRAKTDVTAKHAATAAAVVELVERFERELRETMADLHAFHVERNGVVRRLSMLESTYGDGTVHGERDITHAMPAINEGLIAKFGTQLNTLGHGRIHMSSWIASDTQVPVIDLTVRLTPRIGSY